LSLQEWNQRYREGKQLFDSPAPLVTRFAADLEKGAALDLACGPGRHALYLAEQGWRVTAVDGSPIAIGILRARAREKNLPCDSRIADLERGQFEIQPDTYDLICGCYYLQRDLIPYMKSGVRQGGMIIAIVHLADEATPTRATPGELRNYFEDWDVLHYYEGEPTESSHQHAVAEVVAVKPKAVE